MEMKERLQETERLMGNKDVKVANSCPLKSLRWNLDIKNILVDFSTTEENVCQSICVIGESTNSPNIFRNS